MLFLVHQIEEGKLRKSKQSARNCASLVLCFVFLRAKTLLEACRCQLPLHFMRNWKGKYREGFLKSVKVVHLIAQFVALDTD